MPPLTYEASPPNPYLRALRQELDRARATMLGAGQRPLLDALERFCCEIDRRIFEGRRTAIALDTHREQLEHRVIDLERQVADQADALAKQAERIAGLMPPGEFITDEQFALMQGPKPPLGDVPLFNTLEGATLAGRAEFLP